MIRLGIVGCGDIAQKSYLPALTKEFRGLARVDIMESAIRSARTGRALRLRTTFPFPH